MPRLNTIKPAEGSKTNKTRVGRGIGSGCGKTAGRGHKGQKSRSGGYHKIGFEGGQMPIQRRLPKRGFRSRLAKVTCEVRLSQLEKLQNDDVNMENLLAANIISANTKRVKIIKSGEIKRAFKVMGDVHMTAGARKSIEAAGGKVEA